MSGIVVVTGSSRGIGHEIARLCVETGWHVVGVDQQSHSAGKLTRVFTGDVRDEALIARVFEFVGLQGMPVSLVNAAGISLPESGEFGIDSWSDTISVNLTAVFKWCEHFRRLVMAGDMIGTSIVNIGSLSSHRAFSNNPSYHASKSGVLGLTRSFALELASLGVRANSVSPGYIKTEMTKTSWLNLDLQIQRANSSLLGRWGEPREVAQVVRFLLSEDSSFVTGVDVPVDGGWLAKG